MTRPKPKMPANGVTRPPRPKGRRPKAAPLPEVQEAVQEAVQEPANEPPFKALPDFEWCTEMICDIPSNIRHLAHPHDFVAYNKPPEVLRDPGETGFGKESIYTPREERIPIPVQTDATITRPD